MADCQIRPVIPEERRDHRLTVTAIVTCHNHAQFIGDALSSIISQSGCESAVSVDQIVVVDDGSDDAPAPAAREVVPDVTVLRHRRRRGIAAARNSGWRAARTDAIAFLDADDVWTPPSLAVRARTLQADPTADVAFGSAQVFTGEHVGYPEVARLPGTMLILTRARDLVGNFDESLTVGETLDWVARAVHIGVRFTSVEETVLLRRSHRTNTTRDRSAVRRDLLRVARAAHSRRS